LAAARPILVNHLGWLAHIVEQQGCGIAVPPDDPEAFADALQQLAAAELARREFRRNDLAARLEQVLSAAIVTRSRRLSAGGCSGSVT